MTIATNDTANQAAPDPTTVAQNIARRQHAAASWHAGAARRRPTLPPTDVPMPVELETLRREATRLAAERVEAGKALHAARTAADSAPRRDVAAAAKALRAAKKDPGRVETERAQAALGDARHRLAATDLALDHLAGELAVTLAATAGPWLALLDTERAELLADLNAALDTATGILTALDSVEGSRRWARRAAAGDPSSSWKCVPLDSPHGLAAAVLHDVAAAAEARGQ